MIAKAGETSQLLETISSQRWFLKLNLYNNVQLYDCFLLFSGRNTLARIYTNYYFKFKKIKAKTPIP